MQNKLSDRMKHLKLRHINFVSWYFIFVMFLLIISCYHRKISKLSWKTKLRQLIVSAACSICRSYIWNFFLLLVERIDLDFHILDDMCWIWRKFLQMCFETEERARRLLHNVSALLKPGGYFFGITPDSSTIWWEVTIKSSLFRRSSLLFSYFRSSSGRSFFEILDFLTFKGQSIRRMSKHTTIGVPVWSLI